MTRKLSPTMNECLAFANKHNDELVRYPGGYWAERNAEIGHDKAPVYYFGTGTVQALVNRGAAQYTEHKKGRMGEFPVAIKVVAKGQVDG